MNIFNPLSFSQHNFAESWGKLILPNKEEPNGGRIFNSISKIIFTLLVGYCGFTPVKAIIDRSGIPTTSSLEVVSYLDTVDKEFTVPTVESMIKFLWTLPIWAGTGFIWLSNHYSINVSRDVAMCFDSMVVAIELPDLANGRQDFWKMAAMFRTTFFYESILSSQTRVLNPNRNKPTFTKSLISLYAAFKAQK